MRIIKKCLKVILWIIGAIALIILIFWLCLHYEMNYKKTVCDTAISPDNKYQITLMAIGEPDWPFGSASGRLILKEGKNQIAQTDFELWNDGGSISSGCWKVTWYEDYVEVILSGEEQEDERFILYFDGTQEIQYLNDMNKNAASEELDISESEVLDGDRVIQEQSFDVELNDWGEVQFVSYMPDGVPLMGDVSFLLTKENQIIYTFPAYEEVGLLESVDSVGFQDIDGDNVKDVIVIMTYVSGAGPTGMVPRKAVRIFRAEGSEFILCHDLMLEILFNIEDEEMSVPTICKYIEENEVY